MKGQNKLVAPLHLNVDLKSIKLKELLNKGRANSVYKTNIPGYLIRIQHNVKFDAAELEHYVDKVNHVYAKDKTSKVTLIKEVPGEPLYGNFRERQDGSIERWYKWFKIIQKLPDSTFKNYYRDIIELRRIGYWFDYVNPNNLLLDGERIHIVDLKSHTPIEDNAIRFKDLSPLIDAIWLTRKLCSMPEEEGSKITLLVEDFIKRLFQIAKSNSIGVNMKGVTAKPCIGNILDHIIINNFLNKDF